MVCRFLFSLMADLGDTFLGFLLIADLGDTFLVFFIPFCEDTCFSLSTAFLISSVICQLDVVMFFFIPVIFYFTPASHLKDKPRQ